MRLSTPIKATIADDEAIGTIEDDDDPPVLSLTPATQSVAEDAGSMAFTVSLDAVSAKTVTVDYATANGTAESGTNKDYTATSGMLTFAAGTMGPQTITVTIRNDAIDEENEDFTVGLSNASNATLSGGGTTLSATGTIEDNDDPPVLSLTPATRTVAEDVGTMTLTVRTRRGEREDRDRGLRDGKWHGECPFGLHSGKRYANLLTGDDGTADHHGDDQGR